MLEEPNFDSREGRARVFTLSRHPDRIWVHSLLKRSKIMRFEVVTSVNIFIVIFRVAPCSFGGGY